MNCKICESPTVIIFEKTVLKKHKVNYHQCNSCHFVQTDKVNWLHEAYSSAITSLDIGLLNRNMRMLNEIPKLIDSCFPEAKIMLDYAGGYGVFTRLMRDHGYNFYRQDVYCENLFAKHFDIEDIKQQKFDLVTAFEVFEHFSDPLKEIEALFEFSDNVVFSTELIPPISNDIENWWYIAEETGQHISFFSEQSLEYLAKKFSRHFYTKNRNLHLFSSKVLTTAQINFAFKDIKSKPIFFGLRTRPIYFHVQRESLLEKDFQMIRRLEHK